MSWGASIAESTGPQAWAQSGARMAAWAQLPLDAYVSVLTIVWAEGFSGSDLDWAMGAEAGIRYTIDWGDWIPWLAATAGAATTRAESAYYTQAVWSLSAGLEYSLAGGRHVGLQVTRSARGERGAVQLELTYTIWSWK